MERNSKARIGFQNRWHIIEVNGINQPDIVTNIQFRVPLNFKICTGIMLHCSTAGTVATGYVLGFLTLHFNNKKSNPVQIPVRSKPADIFQKKYAPLALHEPLEAGTLIQGYYQGNGGVVKSPYDLKIYVGGLHEDLTYYE